ncbi:MAG TPA: lysophospholipid acyltransferase family protein [Desulfomonilia bacterium]
MKVLFYKIMHFLAGTRTGIYIAEILTWFITTCYFLMPRPQVRLSMKFYRALFPGRSGFYYLLCAWRQFHHFSTVFTDRLIVEATGAFPCESIGWEHIYNAHQSGKRGILLMSHIGNWELAARKLSDLGINVALFVGSKQAQKIETQMKTEISGKGIKIISVDENESAPLNVFEVLRYLKNEGFVSMTGDRVWSDSQKSMKLEFLDHMVRLPYSPFALAYTLQVPLFVFFIIRTGRAKYRIEYNQPIFLDSINRSNKEKVIQEAAVKYLKMYEDVVRRHPEHWYCFEPFLIEKAGNE